MGLPEKLINKFLNIFEGLTGYVVQLTSDHAYIHQGKALTVLITTPSISAPYHIAFTTPSVESGKYIHWRPIGISTSADYVSLTMKEETSYTIAGGTDVTPINRNRNLAVSRPSLMQAFKQGVASAGTGVEIDLGALGVSGNAATRAGGNGDANEEIVLLPNKTYVITITPAGATVCTLKLFFYQEDGYQG